MRLAAAIYDDIQLARVMLHPSTSLDWLTFEHEDNNQPLAESWKVAAGWFGIGLESRPLRSPCSWANNLVSLLILVSFEIQISLGMYIFSTSCLDCPYFSCLCHYWNPGSWNDCVHELTIQSVSSVWSIIKYKCLLICLFL